MLQRENVLIDFIKVIERTTAQTLIELPESTISKFLAIVDVDMITDDSVVVNFSRLISSLRKYQEISTADNLDTIIKIIKKMYVDLPKCDYKYFPYEDEAAAYVVFDKTGVRINPERIVNFLNDNEFE